MQALVVPITKEHARTVVQWRESGRWRARFTSNDDSPILVMAIHHPDERVVRKHRDEAVEE